MRLFGVVASAAAALLLPWAAQAQVRVRGVDGTRIESVGLGFGGEDEVHMVRGKGDIGCGCMRARSPWIDQSIDR
jgi:hypothetical protein